MAKFFNARKHDDDFDDGGEWEGGWGDHHHNHFHYESEDRVKFTDRLMDKFGKFDLDMTKIDLNLLGKFADWHVTKNGFSVEFGKGYSLTVDADNLGWKMKNGAPVVTKGVIEGFHFESPGLGDFSVTGMHMSAKAFTNAVKALDTREVISLLTGGDETISGSGYHDVLFGGKGQDTLIGNKGNDMLIGGQGGDTFVFRAGDKHDTIMDFGPGDKIDLSSFGFSSFEELARDHIFFGHGHGKGYEFEFEFEMGDDEDEWEFEFEFELEGRSARCGDDDDHHHEDRDESAVLIDLGRGDTIILKGVEWYQLNQDSFIL